MLWGLDLRLERVWCLFNGCKTVHCWAVLTDYTAVKCRDVWLTHTGEAEAWCHVKQVCNYSTSLQWSAVINPAESISLLHSSHSCSLCWWMGSSVALHCSWIGCLLKQLIYPLVFWYWSVFFFCSSSCCSYLVPVESCDTSIFKTFFFHQRNTQHLQWCNGSKFITLH